MKSFLLLFTLSAITTTTILAQTEKRAVKQWTHRADEKDAGKTSRDGASKVPKEINLILQVEELPGISNPKSFWESAYEIRVADWDAVVEKTELAQPLDIGEVLLQLSSPRRSLLERDNRRLSMSIPVAGPLWERLQQQKLKPQAFLLRSTVRVYDAQLDQNFAIQLNRIWQFKLFPDGEATISLKINSDGSYNTWGPIPKGLPPGYSIVGVPSEKIPPSSKP